MLHRRCGRFLRTHTAYSSQALPQSFPCKSRPAVRSQRRPHCCHGIEPRCLQSKRFVSHSNSGTRFRGVTPESALKLSERDSIDLMAASNEMSGLVPERPGYLTPEALAEGLLKMPEKYVVLDVREHDFAGGHIAGARNVPKFQFAEKAASLAQEYLNKDFIVVHCMMSQVRGPHCATLLNARVAQAVDSMVAKAKSQKDSADSKASDADGQPHVPRVVILKGGFEGWQHWWQRASKDKPQLKALMADYEPKYWD